MDQCGGLKRVASGFIRHLVRGEPTEFAMYEGKQIVRSHGVTVFNGLENLGEVTHSFSSVATHTPPVSEIQGLSFKVLIRRGIGEPKLTGKTLAEVSR